MAKTKKQNNQVPTFEVVPRRYSSEGDIAVKLAEAYGRTPDKWQAYVLNKWLSTNKAGDYVAGTVCLTVPRQNGKNATLVMYELFALAVQGRQILHTAHQVKTSREAFMQLANVFSDKNYPELNNMVKAIRYANGQETVELKNGGRVQFIARTRASGLGFTADTVICDEAQDLETEMMEVLSPTLTAAPSGRPLMIMTGTPPRPSTHGTVFRDLRKKVVAKEAKRTTWLEWGVSNLSDIDNPETWKRVNPSYGLHISPAFMEDEYTKLAADSFVREHLGWWTKDTVLYEPIISQIDWDKCIRDPVKEKDEKVAFGIKYSVDGTLFALCAAAKQTDGVFVDCVMIEPTNGGKLAQLVQWLKQRKGRACEIIIDGKAGASALQARLQQAGINKNMLHLATTAQVVSACANFKSMVEEHTLKHAGQEALSNSVLAVQKRKIGSMGDWGFGSGLYDCTPAEAAALAVWCAMTTRRGVAKACRMV